MPLADQVGLDYKTVPLRPLDLIDNLRSLETPNIYTTACPIEQARPHPTPHAIIIPRVALSCKQPKMQLATSSSSYAACWQQRSRSSFLSSSSKRQMYVIASVALKVASHHHILMRSSLCAQGNVPQGVSSPDHHAQSFFDISIRNGYQTELVETACCRLEFWSTSFS